jgi:hypothetical protein
MLNKKIMPFKKYRTLIEIIFLWVFPILTIINLYPIFTQQFSSGMSAFMLLFPALTMYLVVGTGAGYCKFWYFTTSYSIKGVTPTIGLIYSAVINLSGYLVLPLLRERALIFILGVGVCTAFMAIFIDVFLLGSGLFYLKSKKYPLGSNPLKHAISYGYWFFTMVGMWNALGIYWAYQLFLSGQFSLLNLLFLPIVFALPFMLYFLRKRDMLRTIY